MAEILLRAQERSMARSQSRLAAEIDFERNGKQHGFIRLPYSVHRSAYGWIPGGSSLTYVPSALMRRPQTPAALAQGIEMLRTFGAPASGT